MSSTKNEPVVSEVDVEQVIVPVGVAQDGSSYSTRGTTVVATLPGHVFNPSNQSLPAITPEGVTMTRDQADQVYEEAAYAGLILAPNSKEGE